MGLEDIHIFLLQPKISLISSFTLAWENFPTPLPTQAPPAGEHENSSLQGHLCPPDLWTPEGFCSALGLVGSLWGLG